jgi:hypothetical protein
VKPSRTALKTVKKLTRLLPTAAPTTVVLQVLSRYPHGSPISASMQNVGELHTGYNPSTDSCELPRLTGNTVLQDYSLLDSGSRMFRMD